jgi:hypothetical protein
MSAGEREILGLMLQTHAQTVADVLRGTGAGKAPTALAAVAATRTLAVVVDEVLHTLVRQARSEGDTWQAIGDVLHITRQAAYQRFGRAAEDEDEHAMTATQPLPNAANRARNLFEHYTRHEWTRVREDFDATMSQALPEPALSASWDQVKALAGSFEELGEPLVRQIGAHTVVDVPMRFDRAPMKGRVAYDRDGKVAGFFVLRPEVP